MTARVLDVTTAEYHRDPCATPSLSASIARELVKRSPLHAWQIHPRLGKQPREASKDMDTGSLLHALLLGEGLEEFAVLSFGNFTTKAAKEARDEAEARGKIVVLERDYLELMGTSAILRERIQDTGIFLTDGVGELKVEWTETLRDAEPVLCRGMMDHVRFDGVERPTIYDLKSTRSGDLHSVAKHIIEYGYDIQRAAYVSALGKLHPEARGRIDFVDVFFETSAPYAVTPIRLDGQFQNLGEIKWERAVRAWSNCLRTNHWPGYVDGITPIEAPAWAFMDTAA